MQKFIIFTLMLTLSGLVSGQRIYKNHKKISNGKGTLWGYWGYNRSAYTKSDLYIVGPGYDFILKNATASDNPTKKIKDYFDITKFTVPQFNLRIGYYYKEKYALSLGYDHMKYVFDDGNQVLIQGDIDPSLNAVWSGDYKDAQVVTNRSDFHYENSHGLNYIRLELTRTDRLYQNRQKTFAISSNVSLGTGCVLTNNDFNFAGKFERNTASVSGFGFSGHASVRLEFFRHVFLQGELNGGRINLLQVRTDQSDRSAHVQQKYWYGQRNITLGFFAYLKFNDGCSDCPQW